MRRSDSKLINKTLSLIRVTPLVVVLVSLAGGSASGGKAESAPSVSQRTAPMVTSDTGYPIRSFGGPLVDLSPLIAGVSPTNFPSTDLRSKLVFVRGSVQSVSQTNGLEVATFGGSEIIRIKNYGSEIIRIKNYPHPSQSLICWPVSFWAMPTDKVEVDKDGKKISVFDFGALPTPEQIRAFREKVIKEEEIKKPGGPKG